MGSTEKLSYTANIKGDTRRQHTHGNLLLKIPRRKFLVVTCGEHISAHVAGNVSKHHRQLLDFVGEVQLYMYNCTKLCSIQPRKSCTNDWSNYSHTGQITFTSGQNCRPKFKLLWKQWQTNMQVPKTDGWVIGLIVLLSVVVVIFCVKNKLASLGATLVRNYDWLTDLMTYWQG